MYETLIMLKPGTEFTPDDLNELVRSTVDSGVARVERKGTDIRVTTGDGRLDIAWNDAPHVVEESNEIAQSFGVPSQGCWARFEMTGEDAGMDLFNDYMLINERLQATGKFVIFDTQEGALLFD